MFKLNILNISIWVLIGVLVLMIICVIIWRIVTRNKVDGVTSKLDKIGMISKNMNQLILSLNSLHDFQVFFNILFKNKFSKLKYSIVPVIVYNNGTFFLITNIINTKKGDLELNNISLSLSKGNNKIIINNFKVKWYKEIEIYFKSIGINLVTIIPVAGSILKITNLSKIKNLLEIQDIGVYINEQPFGKKYSDFDLKKIFSKIDSINLFKKSGRIRQEQFKGIK